MKYLLALLLLCGLLALPAHAQNYNVITSCDGTARATAGTGNAKPFMDITGKVCDTGGASGGASVTITPQPATPAVGASASITSLVLKASATSSTGGVQYFHAENDTATSGYCILYNGTAAPSTGALTAANVLAFQLLPASGWCDWHAGAQPPITASAGAVVLLSSASSPYTYTTGTITGSIYGLAQ